MKIWLAVTQDRFEFPVAIADSARELAQMVGVKPITILSSVSRSRKRTRKTNRGIRRKYFVVEVEDDDEIATLRTIEARESRLKRKAGEIPINGAETLKTASTGSKGGAHEGTDHVVRLGL